MPLAVLPGRNGLLCGFVAVADVAVKEQTMPLRASAFLELPPEHRAALSWFADREGQEIGWPDPLNGLFLMNKAKGIHKPKGWLYALSVRQSLESPYDDRDPETSSDGSWVYRYFQEGTDPARRDKDFTNRALMHNQADNVPVAVVRQTKRKPGGRYLVLGLANVVGWNEGHFELRRYVA